MAFIESSGLDRTKALEVLLNGAPGSPMVKTLTPRMTAQDYRPFFGVSLMAKDLTYAVAEAQQHNIAGHTRGKVVVDMGASKSGAHE